MLRIEQLVLTFTYLFMCVRGQESGVASFGDKTTGLSVFDSVEYLDRIVYIYAPMSNSGQEVSVYQRFYYLPLMMPAHNGNSSSSSNSWIRLVDSKRVKIELMQGNKKLKEVIRDSLAKRFATNDTTNWDIMPLMIDSITVYIKNGDSLVSGIQPIKLVHPDTYVISFQVQLASKQLAQELIKKILSEEYEIELSIRYTSFKKSLALYAFEHMQRAYSETIADEQPATHFSYILKSQASQFAADLTGKIIETILLVDPSQSKDLTTLRSKFMILITNAISKLEQSSINVDQYFEVWSGDELEPDLLKTEINSLFTYSQEETERRDDGRSYFFVDSTKNNNSSLSIGHQNSQQKWINLLRSQLQTRHQKVYSESEIAKFMDKNSVEGEWIGIKFTPSQLKVISMEAVLESIKSKLISKRIYQEEVQGTIVKRVAITGSTHREQLSTSGGEEYALEETSSSSLSTSSSFLTNLSSTLMEKLNKIENTVNLLHSSMKNGESSIIPSRVQPDSVINTRSGWVRLAVFDKLNYLVTGNKQLHVYDLQTKELKRVLTGHSNDDVYDVKRLGDNKLISLSASQVKVWNVETGESLATSSEPLDSIILNIDLNSHQTLLAGGSSLNHIVLWDVSEMKQKQTFRGHSGRVYSVAFDNLNDQLISGSEDSTIRVWSMNGEVKHILSGHVGTITRLVVDERTGLLYSGADDGKIKEWDLRVGGECLRTLHGHTDHIRDLILSEDGSKLISSSRDKTIVIWHKQSGRVIETLSYSEEFVRLAVNPVNDQLVSSTIDGQVQFWPHKPTYIEKDVALINQQVNWLARSEHKLSDQVSKILSLLSNNQRKSVDHSAKPKEPSGIGQPIDENDDGGSGYA